MKNQITRPSLLLLLSFLLTAPLFAQIQIGKDLNGFVDFERSGYDVALSAEGTRLATGAAGNSGMPPGAVRVYDWQGGEWLAIGNDLRALTDLRSIGAEVELSADGKRLAIAGGISGGYAVQVFDLIDNNWSPVGSTITQAYQGLSSGYRLSLTADGKRLAFGVLGIDNFKGQVKVFELQGDSWVALGSEIKGSHEYAYFGDELHLSTNGERLAVGETGYNSGSLSRVGRVCIFEWRNNKWEEIGAFVGTGEKEQLGNAASLSADGKRIAIGTSKYNTTAFESGRVQVYEQVGTDWEQLGSSFIGEGAYHWLGSSVSLSPTGEWLIIGAPSSATNPYPAGIVRIFRWIQTDWQEVGSPIEGEHEGDRFGRAIALASRGNILAIGAARNSDPFSWAGHVRVFNLGALTKVNAVSTPLHIKVSPNPTDGYLQVEGDDIQSLELLDGRGVKLWSSQHRDDLPNLSTQASGCYYLLIRTSSSEVLKTVVKE